ncbi:HlyD family type I secretion periplasmic adaptor subunit [Magnetospirillum sp. SS-4]|uniref:HlyD family type I secretion periplasmic adaptor subunit n=1 Tax=Magnetospirillum sp. SS-4 TaxID=2681465 RepID=UPI00137FA9A3|nr:HlyD family type I secretion periplasmic adaptor subunit [Magnetospirillum sp. SS-4]CAA7624561.1 putative Type I secretion system membrane fusion protein PrsE [Magnetospirillum sp. SS-4]
MSGLPLIAAVSRIWQSLLHLMRIEPEPSGDQARRYFRIGVLVLVGYALFLTGWSALAPLAGATMAPGVVVVNSNRKTVQHLNGGTIQEILVAEGERVSEGQALVVLDGTVAEANLDALSVEYWGYLARISRLQAERDNRASIQWSSELTAQSHDSRVKRLISDETSAFDQRRKSMEGQVSILRSRIAQFNKVIIGLQAQLNATTKQRGHLAEELSGVQALFDQGFERKPRLLQLRRQADEMAGLEGRLTEEIAKTKLTIAETELNIRDLANQQRSEAAGELNEVQGKIFEITEKIRAARHIVDNLIIAAPRSGVVVNLQIHTVGGVVAPGQALMDIVPNTDSLVVEGKVKPEDINDVQVGLPVEVALTSYRQSVTPRLKGRVEVVSADRMTDPKTGLSYFLVRVSIPTDEREKIAELGLFPGMPAELYIVNKPTSAFSLLFQPFTDSLNRGFTR